MFDVSYHVGKVVFSNLFVDLFVVGIVCVNGAVPGAMWLGMSLEEIQRSRPC